MGWLANLLGGTLVKVLGEGILGPVLAHLDKKQDADLERYKAAVSAEIEANRQRQAMAGEFKLLVYLTALPFILHAGAVMLDSTFSFGWAVPKAPEPFAGYEGAILLSFFVLSPAASVARAFSLRLVR